MIWTIAKNSRSSSSSSGTSTRQHASETEQQRSQGKGMDETEKLDDMKDKKLIAKLTGRSAQ
jgi:hypothetical protein